VGLLAVLLAAGGYWVAEEIETSRFQATQLAAYARSLSFQVLKGPSEAIRFPLHGPFDQRMGYTELPRFAQRLTDRGYALTEQARFSKDLLDYTGHGLFAPYREKTRAGLDMADCRGKPLHGFRYPYRGYADFAAVPPRVAQALMFIENRDLLDESRPADEPGRRLGALRPRRARPGRASGEQRFRRPRRQHPGHPDRKVPPLPRRRHLQRQREAAPDGLGQRARLPGRRGPCRPAGACCSTTSTPCRCRRRPGMARSMASATACGCGSRPISTPPTSCSPRPKPAADLAAQGRALHQVVALMIAHRRPSFYLCRWRARAAGAIVGELPAPVCRKRRDQPRPARRGPRRALKFRDMQANPALLPADLGKGTMTLRNRLAGMLDASLYELDRFDADVSTTLDGALQKEVSEFLERLAEPEFARKQGLAGERMLSPASLKAVRYSFNLVESTPAATACGCRPTPATRPSTSTKAASSSSAPPPSCGCSPPTSRSSPSCTKNTPARRPPSCAPSSPTPATG
jgi:hypothetical protein